MQSSKSYVIITTEAEGFAERICDLNKIVDFRYYAPNTSLRGIKQMLYMQVRTNKNFLERRILKWQVRQKRPQRCFSHLMCVGAFAGCGGNGNNGGTGSTAGGSSAGGTESTASTASTASSAGEASIPTVAEITERLKTEAKDGKISLKVWAPSNSKTSSRAWSRNLRQLMLLMA